jgi:hypothetical protein
MNSETAKKLLDKTLSDMGYVEPELGSSSRDPMYMTYSYDPNHDSNGMGVYKTMQSSNPYKKFSSNIESSATPQSKSKKT